MNGGELVARVLERHEVRFLFTLCGGHISPILVEAKRRGIRVVDTRHEVTAVFAADAVGRLTGVPGVAAVTAGPGVTNTITAVKNAQLAQSPLLLLGGATATVLSGRGSLQDIDQMALMEPHVKWATSVSRVRKLPGVLEEALWIAREGVPGPVFVECPVDLLYDEETVRGWYGAAAGGGTAPGIGRRIQELYLRWHLGRLFAGADQAEARAPRVPGPPLPHSGEVKRAAARLERSERPVLVVGSQALLEPAEADELAHALEHMGVPVYLTGMARGLLGARHPLHVRHQRRKALKEADFVVLAGAPADFRLDYGRQIGRGAFLVGVNRSGEELVKNRRPDLAVHADPGRFLRLLSQTLSRGEGRWGAWQETLRERDDVRTAEIADQAHAPSDKVHPLLACHEIDGVLPERSVLVADGGDFVASASYVVSPRGPLRWLDPGVFGTLGVGAGFALGAKLVYPESEVWILYGDGSVGYSLAELDTFVRHGLPVIAVVGNDASWAQIAREQVEVLGDPVGTVLRHTDYHAAGEGLGGEGLLVRKAVEMGPALAEARRLAAAGRPVVVNVLLGASDFRKGSISI